MSDDADEATAVAAIEEILRTYLSTTEDGAAVMIEGWTLTVASRTLEDLDNDVTGYSRLAPAMQPTHVTLGLVTLEGSRIMRGFPG